LADPIIARMPEIAAQSDPPQWLSKQIAVKQEGESEFYKVSYASCEPKSAMQVVNAVVDRYFQHREDEKNSRSGDVIKILEEEQKIRRNSLQKLRETVREAAKNITGKDPFAGNGESVAVVNHPVADIQKGLVSAEVEQTVLEARLMAAKEAAACPLEIPDSMVARKLEEHPQIVRMKQELYDLQTQLKNLDVITVRREKDPEYNRLSQEIKATEKYLQDSEKELRGKIREELQTAVASKYKEQIAALESQLASCKKTVEVLNDKYQVSLKNIKQSSGDSVELRLDQMELDRAEKLDGLIAQRILELRTEKGAPERVTLFEKAEMPTAPINAPYKNMLLALLAGLGLPFGLALGWEKLQRRVGDAAILENEARHRVLGEIARLPSRPLGSSSRAPNHLALEMRMFEESIDSLRTNLMLDEELRHVRFLAVTSATNHEGKTSVAAQLALSLARATESPILLIDGDTRAPDLHNIFDMPLEPGLTKVLEGSCLIEEAIITVGKSNLDVLPAGKLESNPHQLLGNGSQDAFRKSIPDRYRYVIIDTPPILAASESLMLASLADASIVCVLRDVSRIDQVRKAYDRLQSTGGNPVGLVLNGVPSKSYAYHYGSYAYAKH
jgi:capsular exopolysaccharide synthesis family protein